MCRWKHDFQAILDNPEKLGAFLDEAAEISELEKIAREQAMKTLLRGRKIRGWILRRQQQSFVSPSSLAPLAKETLPELLETIGNISERRYRALCSRCGVAPDPTAIIKTGASVYLSRTSLKISLNESRTNITAERRGYIYS